LSINDEYGAPISTLIQRNLINNSQIGISINIQYSQNNKATLQNNTITNNTSGLQIGSSNVPAITNNNIYGNSYNAKLVGVSSQISLPNNWWGTNDIQSINQTMYDFKYDFTLSTINFLPILGAPNTQAIPNSSVSTPTPTLSTSPTEPTATLQVPEFPSLVIAPLILSVFVIALMARYQKAAESVKKV
jgi:hypothetical protein